MRHTTLTAVKAIDRRDMINEGNDMEVFEAWIKNSLANDLVDRLVVSDYIHVTSMEDFRTAEQVYKAELVVITKLDYDIMMGMFKQIQDVTIRSPLTGNLIPMKDLL